MNKYLKELKKKIRANKKEKFYIVKLNNINRKNTVKVFSII